MGSIVACEGYEHHIDDGQNGEGRNAKHRKSQKSLVELIIQQRAEIVARAPDLFAAGGDVHAYGALLHLNSPCINEGNDEDDGQKTVKQDLDGVIAGDPYIRVIDNIIDEASLNIADGIAGAQEVHLVQPVKTAGGHEHIAEEYYFKREEKNTSQDLSIEKVAEAKDKERNFNGPVAFYKGTADFLQSSPDTESAVSEEVKDIHNKLAKPAGDSADKQLELIQKCTGLAQLQIIEIA